MMLYSSTTNSHFQGPCESVSSPPPRTSTASSTRTPTSGGSKRAPGRSSTRPGAHQKRTAKTASTQSQFPVSVKKSKYVTSFVQQKAKVYSRIVFCQQLFVYITFCCDRNTISFPKHPHHWKMLETVGELIIVFLGTNSFCTKKNGRSSYNTKTKCK